MKKILVIALAAGFAACMSAQGFSQERPSKDSVMGEHGMGHPRGMMGHHGKGFLFGDPDRMQKLLGLTDEEMSEFFGVTAQTFYNWQKEHIAFFEAVQSGKLIADAEVAHSLYKKATGITYQVERLRKNADGVSEIVKISVYEPPDTGAMKLWLTNRRRKDWSENVKVSGDEDAPIRHVIERRIVSRNSGD